MKRQLRKVMGAKNYAWFQNAKPQKGRRQKQAAIKGWAMTWISCGDLSQG